MDGNMGNMKYKLVYLREYSPIEYISKALYDQDIHTVKYGRKYCGNYSY